MIFTTHICFPVFLLFTLIVEPNSKIGIGGQSCYLFSTKGYQGHNTPLSSSQSPNCTSNLASDLALWEMEGRAARRASRAVKHGIIMSQAQRFSSENISVPAMGKAARVLEKSKGMRHFSRLLSHSLAEQKQRRTPMSGWITRLEFTHSRRWGARSHQMPDADVTVIAHFLRVNRRSVPAHSLLPSPGLCAITYSVSRAVAFGDINREVCADKAREPVGKGQDRERLWALSQEWKTWHYAHGDVGGFLKPWWSEFSSNNSIGRWHWARSRVVWLCVPRVLSGAVLSGLEGNSESYFWPKTRAGGSV